ncbi:MAG: class I SAM-dependent methyltransferase [Stappiaceae bacterium]
MEQTIRFWDRHAAGYAKSPIKNMEGYTYTLTRTRSYLKATDRALELGAGTGSTALELAPSVAHITATDISPAMIDIGKEKARHQGIDNIDFLAADSLVSNLEGPYDVILAHNLLHLVEDLPATLKRVHALLKPGGLFISKTFCKPARIGPPLYYAMRLALPLMRLFGKAPYVAVMRIAELETAITDEGFTIIETGNYPAKELSRYIVARR